MIEKLTKNPDQLFEITDDSEAKLLLTQLGLVDKFRKKVPGVESSNQIATGTCKTHYILALYFTGKTVETDNGYLVYAVPKSEVSVDQMIQYTAAILTGVGMVSDEPISWGSYSDKSN